ncbi:MAG: hypothetical protein R3A52_24495 [Polyangiales bacterium]
MLRPSTRLAALAALTLCLAACGSSESVVGGDAATEDVSLDTGALDTGAMD